MKRVTLIAILCLTGTQVTAQRFHAGVNFQYLIAKQISVDADYILPLESYNFYKITDNRWKLFSGGQSFVIGTAFQYDYKKFYVAFEPGYELNSYNYKVEYPLRPGVDEEIVFQHLYFQIDAPAFLGFQFKSADIIRYSVFAGAGPVIPYMFQYETQEQEDVEDVDAQYNRYRFRDMNGILYNDKSYWNGIVGLGVNFASLFRLDFRYVRRFGSPGDRYKTTFNTAGFGITYYLPLHVLRKKVYYEE